MEMLAISYYDNTKAECRFIEMNIRIFGFCLI